MPPPNELLQEGRYPVNPAEAPGQDLVELLKQNSSQFALTDIVRWSEELLDELDAVHRGSSQSVHGYVRPHTVHVGDDRKVRLDKNLNEPTHAQGESDLHYSPLEAIWPGLDPASQKVITNSYDERSERILKEPLDARSDIYSLGATLYFLVTGREPIDPLERSIEILEGRLDPLREPTKINPQIPPEVSDVLMKALEVKRENRYDSAVIMRHVLTAALKRFREREANELREQEKEAADLLRLTGANNAPPEKIYGGHAPSPNNAFDELLEIPGEPSAEVVAYRGSDAEINSEELAAVLREIEEVEAQQLRESEEVGRAVHDQLADLVVEDPLLDALSPELFAKEEFSEPDRAENSHLEATEEPNGETGDKQADPVPAAAREVVDHQTLEPSQPSEPASDVFTLREHDSKSRLSMPAIAGAVGVLVIIGVGIWLAMSGSVEAPRAVSDEPAQVAQPSRAEEPPLATFNSTNTSAEQSLQPDVEPVPLVADAPAVERQASSQPRQRKPSAPKPQQEKKKVTVDDLINDN